MMRVCFTELSRDASHDLRPSPRCLRISHQLQHQSSRTAFDKSGWSLVLPSGGHVATLSQRPTSGCLAHCRRKLVRHRGVCKKSPRHTTRCQGSRNRLAQRQGGCGADSYETKPKAELTKARRPAAHLAAPPGLDPWAFASCRSFGPPPPIRLGERRRFHQETHRR
jgi:hypothetical protein